MISDLQLLEKHPFFRNINREFLAQLSKFIDHVSFKEDELIIQAGCQADKFYLITKGRVNILTEKLDARKDTDTERVAIQTLGPGEILGWSWLIPPHKWHFDAKAVTPAEAIVLDGEYVRNQCEKDKNLGYELLKRLTNFIIQRLTATRLQLSIHSGKPFGDEEGH